MANPWSARNVAGLAPPPWAAPPHPLPPAYHQPHPNFVRLVPPPPSPPPPPASSFHGYPVPGFAAQPPSRHYNFGPPPPPPRGPPGPQPLPFHGPNPLGFPSPRASSGPPTLSSPPIAHQVGSGTRPSSDNLGPGEQEEEVPEAKKEEGVAVVERAILQSRKEAEIDVKSLLLQIRALVARAQEAVQKVGAVAKLDHPSLLEPNLATCPYDSSHRLPPEALFKHTLSCPSNPKPQILPKNLIPPLQYPRTQPSHGGRDSKSQEEDPASQGNATDDVKGATGAGGRGNSIVNTEIVRDGIKAVSKKSDIDIWGSRFYYRDCTAVVQVPLPTPYPPALPTEKEEGMDGLEEFETLSGTDGTTADLSVAKMATGEGSRLPLLASWFWFLRRETEAWRELPSRCSSLVLQAAAEVWRIRKEAVSEWLLMQAPVHGVVIDAAMANHLQSLAIVCLRSLQRRASALTHRHAGQTPNEQQSNQEMLNDGDMKGSASEGTEECVEASPGPEEVEEARGRIRVTCLDCPGLFQGGHWLASQLSVLFGPIQSKVFVLKLLKHCLVSSGRSCASAFVEAVSDQSTEGGGDEKQQTDDPLSRSMDDWSVSSLEIKSALVAVHERAIVESYLRTLTHPSKSSRFQLIREHEAAMSMAAAERLKRVDYRPVSEHDGLIWHRSQIQEKGKNKTREELLAEERDYKRRRMSYRGKKLKRTPTEVVHDIIEGHMQEIREAGGIGCFTKDTYGNDSTKIESSRGSNLPIKGHTQDPKWTGDGLLPVPVPTAMKPQSSPHGRDSWNGPSRGPSTGREDWSNEVSSSRTLKTSALSDGNTIPQSMKYHSKAGPGDVSSERTESGSRYKGEGRYGDSPRQDFRQGSGRRSDQDSHSSHNSRSGRDYSRESEEHWRDTSVEYGTTRSSSNHRRADRDHRLPRDRRDDRQSHRQYDRWEVANEDDDGSHRYHR